MLVLYSSIPAAAPPRRVIILENEVELFLANQLMLEDTVCGMLIPLTIAKIKYNANMKTCIIFMLSGEICLLSYGFSIRVRTSKIIEINFSKKPAMMLFLS